MRRTIGRTAAIAVATAAVTAGLAVMPPAASAAHLPKFITQDSVLQPGDPWGPTIRETSGWAKGTVVYAVSGKPLDGQAGAPGLPKGVTRTSNSCKAVAGYTTVFACQVEGGFTIFPEFAVAKDAADMTTVYVGYAYVPEGGDLAAGVTTAQSASALPASDVSGTVKATVLTYAHAARNTTAFDIPDLPSGGSVRHHLRLHAIDPGRLYIVIRPAEGEPLWRDAKIAVSGAVSSDGAVCKTNSAFVNDTAILACDVSTGEQTVDYTLSAPVGMEDWRLSVETGYDVYRGALYLPDSPPQVVWSSADFAVTGGPRLYADHGLLARNSAGQLFWYAGTGKAAGPLYDKYLVGSGWNTYTALTRLSPLANDPDSVPASSPAPQGSGDLVGRDSSGTLWYYHRIFNSANPFASRVKVGPGWNTYTALAGGDDLNQDGRADLLARDAQGTLWFYAGTGKPVGPFAARTKVGPGWNTYTQLAGSADVTGDGIPDLLARDGTGALWLYRGTGKAAGPFAARTKVGPGWNTYTQVSLVGDLNRDGRADLVGRDSTGMLWLYTGTGKAAGPLAARTKVGPGWNTYSQFL